VSPLDFVFHEASHLTRGSPGADMQTVRAPFLDRKRRVRKMWRRGTHGGVHAVSAARAGTGVDVYELCACHAPALLEGKEDDGLYEWVRVYVPLPCKRHPSASGRVGG
jgi:hypothetical protein